MGETENKENTWVDTSNIFDDFGWNWSKKLNKKSKMELIYLIKFIGVILRIVATFLFISILITSAYVNIQNSTDDKWKNKEYLGTICGILNGWEILWNGTCTPLAITIKDTQKIIDELSKDYLSKLIPTLVKNYEMENVKNSKESIFVINKSKQKNDPVLILDEFDKAKNLFTSIEKSKIQCENIIIEWKVIEIECTSYAGLWDDEIPGFDWDINNHIGWTSISLASSFINYLSKSNNFNVIERQKSFSSELYSWEWSYTNKTDFSLKLEYIGPNDLSL